jgi:hypothetical protein
MIKPVFKMQFIVNKEYRMDYEVKNIKMDAEFKICPTCGYEDGFHSMFKKEDDITRWLFICSRFKVIRRLRRLSQITK